jgi:TPR repeat protein
MLAHTSANVLAHRNAFAQYDLGTFYQSGKGVVQDYMEAARLYRLAADQGAESAQYRLGKCYHDGEGVAHDYTEACSRRGNYRGAQHSSVHGHWLRRGAAATPALPMAASVCGQVCAQNVARRQVITTRRPSDMAHQQQQYLERLEQERDALVGTLDGPYWVWSDEPRHRGDDYPHSSAESGSDSEPETTDDSDLSDAGASNNVALALATVKRARHDKRLKQKELQLADKRLQVPKRWRQ